MCRNAGRVDASRPRVSATSRVILDVRHRPGTDLTHRHLIDAIVRRHQVIEHSTFTTRDGALEAFHRRRREFAKRRVPARVPLDVERRGERRIGFDERNGGAPLQALRDSLRELPSHAALQSLTAEQRDTLVALVRREVAKHTEKEEL